ncbi:MAG TPA: class II aldolase/adducin family protein, partial [Candidatus Brocadiia bacterium]|nr:class II aldolase/adducin family protein [Candidatus Brocadiia bacterium]
EAGFHRGVLLARSEMNVVFHFQSRFATAFACAAKPVVDFNVIPEIPYYIGEIGWVDYLAPGSPELADEVIRVMRGCDLAFMRNHGLVTVGKDFDDALQKAAFFELACEILASGVKTAPLTPDAAAALRNKGQSARKI